MSIKSNPEMTDEENPEWTDEMIKHSVGFYELPVSLQSKLRGHPKLPTRDAQYSAYQS